MRTCGADRSPPGSNPTRSAVTVAIWSLCVSKPDLVTHILDTENESDQIDPDQAAAPVRPLDIADVD